MTSQIKSFHQSMNQKSRHSLPLKSKTSQTPNITFKNSIWSQKHKKRENKNKTHSVWSGRPRTVKSSQRSRHWIREKERALMIAWIQIHQTIQLRTWKMSKSKDLTPKTLQTLQIQYKKRIKFKTWTFPLKKEGTLEVGSDKGIEIHRFLGFEMGLGEGRGR